MSANKKAGAAGSGRGAVRAPEEPRKPAEYSVAELARAAQTTIRNIRAYQDRGLIPPPERRGRVGVYGDLHLSRLRIIGQMLGRGYTLHSIGEMLEAWETGTDLSGLFGLESAVSSPWTDEVEKQYTLAELVKLFGGGFNVRWLVKAADLNILIPEGAKFRAPSPRMIHAGAELVKAGIPLDEMLDVVGKLRRNVEEAADRMVQLVEKYLFDPYGKGLPPPDQVPRLGEIIWRLRPLVEMAVHAEVARAMELSATRHLGDRLATILDRIQRPAAEAEASVRSERPSRKDGRRPRKV
ncbi:MerR family transcriptional regulator [Fontimonas sp. SYSU GA230001]|uniref:MerR family transcriptional regulator n=1 Tax=Fontimonas sp. SYSU GA230001 TaxID=3142450 RepID=UPI0032B5A19E